MDKAYNHKEFEKRMYQLWEESGAFQPSGATEPFGMIMPPPNANDDLHIGHARFVTIEDVLARYWRMKGKAVLWLPGADHAGIETQFVFEKKLKEQGKSRFDYSRDELYRLIWEYVQKNKQVMQDQLRSLGASCDWTREKFTLDPDIVGVVYRTFAKLHSDGLVYRKERLVNYCTRCGTAYSELEVDHREKEGEIYTLDYGTVKVATTRPETIFADVAVAVNPNDIRLAGLIGKTAKIPLIGREVPIIGDEAVEVEMGTGALKVTPAHDFTDAEIGERHGLEKIVVISREGKLIDPAPEKYQGMYVNEARKAVVEDLQSGGGLIKTEKTIQIVGSCYRCKNPIEPLPYWQWFVKVEPLVKLAREAVSRGETKFAAERFEKIYFHWLDKLKDWNISRQIVWGIQIPAWKCESCQEWTVTEGEEPDKCQACGASKLVRDEDTFDTWFSSGQWPFATLETTGKGDLDKFYPTEVMETGFDILPFWVMRMMMLGLYMTGKVPFKKVLIHGLVRDKAGQKISKSKGNVINPLEMTEKYGTDALRMALVWGALVESDISLAEDNIRGQRNFANKIWNIARYVEQATKEPIGVSEKGKEHEDDVWIKGELHKTVKLVSEKIEEFRLNEAAEEVYELVWHKLADVYIEKTKGRKGEAKDVLGLVWSGCLKLLHPFMPFVTEAVWQESEMKDSPTLMEAKWPEA